MKTLTFQNTTLVPVKTDNQIWLSSADLAKALGYSQSRAVSKLYNENQDEFTPSMTALVPNPHMKNANICIFSLKGCHLIAMFSRTAVAKAFRKWVLRISLIKKWVYLYNTTPSASSNKPKSKKRSKPSASNKLHYQALYHHLYDKFGVKSYKDILAVDFEQALAFIYEYAFCHNRNINFAYNCTSESIYQNIKSQEQLDHMLTLMQSMVNSIGEMQARLKKQDHLLRSSQQLLK